MKRDDESSDEGAPWREPNGGDTNCDRVALLSNNTRAAAASSQSATGLVELDLSLPTAIDDAVVAAESLVHVRRPQRAGGCHGSNKSYQDIVPTQVYTLPHREGTPVRLSMPLRLSTAGQQQLLRHHRACAVGVKSQSARCSTHPSRAQAKTFNRSKSQAGRCHDVGFRIALVPPATQQQQQQQQPQQRRRQQLDDDPSATNTISSSKKAGQLSVTPHHPNRIRIGDVRSATQNQQQQQQPKQQQQQSDEPSAMSTRSSKKAGQLLAVTTSHHPTSTRIIGGVHSQVENDPRGHRPPKPPLTARSSARQRRRPETFLAVQAPDVFLAVQVQARETTRRWKVAAPRPPLKPRPLSAPARGRAIRRAVDRCCHDLPATSELSYGGTRFLRQWDGASRRQRGQILKALADQLLVGSGGQGGDLFDDKQLEGVQGGGSYDDEQQQRQQQQQQQQQQQPSVPVDFQSSNEVIKKRTEGARREPPSGQQIIKLESTGTPHVEFIVSSPACSVLGDSSGTAPNNVLDSTSTKKVRPRHFCWGYEGGATGQPGGTIETADEYANGTGFLELLGAHTGLLVARISSYLRTLHSSDHAIGICLRVTTLLAESTFETARGGSRGGIRGSANSGGGGGGGGGSGSGNYSNATSLAQQLSTPGILRVALETVALETTVVSKPASIRASKPEAEPKPKPGAKLEAKLAYTKLVYDPEAKPASKPDAKPAAVVESVMALKGARTRTPSSPREEENNRTQALRLLLALVRAGGTQIKEHLTSSSSSIPGADKSGDALGPILVALRRSGCSLETRKAAGKLLVELGVGNPAGSGRVWNAVLSVLGQEKCGEAQVLGCDVSRELLLSTLGADCSSSGSSSSSVIGGIPSGFVWRQEHQLRPEVLLVPSTLTLSFSDCSATREAAGALATFLVNFSGPCCYLLVAGLVGLLGDISGMKHSAPIYWRRRHHSSSRCEPTTKPCDKKELELRSKGTPKSRDEHKLEVCWSELHQPTHRRVAEIVGPGSNAYRLNKAGFFCEVDFESPDGTNNNQQCDTDSVIDDGNEIVGGGRGGSGRSAASERDKFLDRKPARSVSGSTDIDNHVIRAMEVLRRFCSGKGGADVCLALLSTLAPLAVLNLVVGPEKTEELPSDNENNDRSAEDTTGESTFITQSRTTPDEYATRTATDGCAVFAKEEEEIETEEVRTGATKNCDLRRHGAASHPHRGIEDNFIEDGRAIPHQGKKEQPRQAYFLAVAEVLLAMYRLCGGCFLATTTTTTTIDQIIRTTENSHRCAPPTPLPLTADLTHGNSTPTPPPFPPDNTGDGFTQGREGDKKGAISSEVLELKRMIDAALVGCRTLPSSLRNGDTTALARVFSASADDCHADREEISTLRKNILALTKRLHGARPPAGDKQNATRQQDGLRDAYEEDGGDRRRRSTAGG